jgi:hypothetical protein
MLKLSPQQITEIQTKGEKGTLKTQDILKHTPYPNDKQLSLQDFEKIADHCQVYYNEQNAEFPTYSFAGEKVGKYELNSVNFKIDH